MPMLLGKKGKEILQWRACVELVGAFRESLTRRWDDATGSEAEALLEALDARLKEELDNEEELTLGTDALLERIGESSSAKELGTLRARYRELIGAHFGRRGSVPVLFELCGTLHDALLRRAVALATQRMRELGQGEPPPFALLVSGDRARGEQTLYSENRYLLLHEQLSPRLFLFHRQLAAALQELGLIRSDRMFWHGSPEELRTTLQGPFAPGRSKIELTSPLAAPERRPLDLPDWEYYLEAQTDLVCAAGDSDLADAGVAAAAKALAEIRRSGALQQLARRVAALPLALGRFARWRLQREGANLGQIDFEAGGLAPLVMAIRILSVATGADSGGTLPRIEALVERSALPVELAERLLTAFRCFAQARARSEIRNESAGAHCDPATLDAAAEERFRASVETVLNLQRILYQRITGQG